MKSDRLRWSRSRLRGPTLAASLTTTMGIIMGYRPIDTLPGWLQTVVDINPVSYVVSALGELMNDGEVTMQVVWALVGCAAIVAVFIPLSVRSYSKKV